MRPRAAEVTGWVCNMFLWWERGWVNWMGSTDSFLGSARPRRAAYEPSSTPSD
jgi:hypothetical protein